MAAACVKTCFCCPCRRCRPKKSSPEGTPPKNGTVDVVVFQPIAISDSKERDQSSGTSWQNPAEQNYQKDEPPPLNTTPPPDKDPSPELTLTRNESPRESVITPSWNIPNVVEGGINDIKDEFTALGHEEQVETNREGTEDTDGSDESIVEKEEQSQDNYSSKDHKAENKNIMINSGFSQGPGLSVSSHSVDGRTSSVTLNSPEIYAVIPGMTSTSSIMMGGRVLIGDDNKMIWSETPGEVVVVERDKCTKILYQKRTQVSNETMSSSDCAQVLEKIQQLKKEANELSDHLSMMGEQIRQSVQRSMEKLFYPRFPSGSNINNNNGMNYYNYNNSPFGNSFPFGSNNSPFGNNFPFGSNNSPFANNFPSGFNDNPFTRYSGNYSNLGSTGTYDTTGSNGIYGNPSGAGFYGSTGSNGITGNAAMAGRAAIYDNPGGAGFYPTGYIN